MLSASDPYYVAKEEVAKAMNRLPGRRLEVLIRCNALCNLWKMKLALKRHESRCAGITLCERMRLNLTVKDVESFLKDSTAHGFFMKTGQHMAIFGIF